MSRRTAAEARSGFAETVNEVAYGKQRIVLTRRGKELVAVIPIEDLKLLEELEDRIDLRDARRALKEAKRSGTIPWEDLKSSSRGSRNK